MSQENMSETGDQNVQRKTFVDSSGKLERNEKTSSINESNQDETIKIFLNPNAPDFNPTNRRKSGPVCIMMEKMIDDELNSHQTRTRYHSDTNQQDTAHLSASSSIIRPLLSLMPELNQSTRPLDYRRRSHTGSSTSTQSKSTVSPSLVPLMLQTTSFDNNLAPTTFYDYQRTRSSTVRDHAVKNEFDFIRQRSHSGPGTLLSVSNNHLSGIHSLTKIMIDILRSISPRISIIQEESQSLSTSPTSLLASNKYPQPSNFVSQGHQQITNKTLDNDEDSFVSSFDSSDQATGIFID